MQRRTLIKLGVVGGAAFALGAGALAWLRPGWEGGRFTPAGRELFGAVARGVLEGVLPEAPAARRAALMAHLRRLEATIAGLPPPTQAEVAELSAILLHPAGRIALTGLGTDWAAADPAALRGALQGLRESRLALKQQAYHALRDLTNGAWFSDPSTWAPIGYPGPMKI
jgi:hypothetical protein